MRRWSFRNNVRNAVRHSVTQYNRQQSRRRRPTNSENGFNDVFWGFIIIVGISAIIWIFRMLKWVYDHTGGMFGIVVLLALCAVVWKIKLSYKKK